MKLELWYPLDTFVISQNFGENLNPFYKQLGMLGHNGIDMVGNTGQIIRAAHDGVVTFTGEDSSAGLGVVIRTNEAMDYGDKQVFWKSIYWHCLPNSFRVKPGDQVKTGDIIAQCDTTGLATGAHLHFGLKPVLQGEQDWMWYNVEQNNGYFGAIDPAPYFNKFYAKDRQQVIDTLRAIIGAAERVIALLKQKLT